eukprot:2788316-Lingulodinium_polyedra.AAC.1
MRPPSLAACLRCPCRLACVAPCLVLPPRLPFCDVATSLLRVGHCSRCFSFLTLLALAWFCPLTLHCLVCPPQ